MLRGIKAEQRGILFLLAPFVPVKLGLRICMQLPDLEVIRAQIVLLRSGDSVVVALRVLLVSGPR